MPGDAPSPAAVLAGSAKGLAAELARAIGAALSRTVRPGPVDVGETPAQGLADLIGGKAAAFCLEFGGVCRGRAAVLFSAEAAGALAGLVKDLKGAELEAKARGEFDDSDLEELGVTVAGALAGLAEKLAEVIGEAPGLGLGDTLTVPAGEAGELITLLGNDPYPYASFDLKVESLAKGHALIVFPGSFAEMPDAGGERGSAGAAAGGGGGGATVSGVIGGLHPNIRRILRLKMPVSVIVAEKDMPLEIAVRLAPGAIIEFSKNADADLDLMVNRHKIGSGEVVIIGERFGIQLRHIEGLEQRIKKLGAARPRT